jgi:hypothetical protein
MWDADSPSLDFSERPLRVKLRNSRNEQIFSALPPITDILGGRLARLSSGGRECFYSISNIPRMPLGERPARVSFRVRSESFVLYLSLRCLDASGGRKRPGRPN